MFADLEKLEMNFFSIHVRCLTQHETFPNVLFSLFYEFMNRKTFDWCLLPHIKNSSSKRMHQKGANTMPEMEESGWNPEGSSRLSG